MKSYVTESKAAEGSDFLWIIEVVNPILRCLANMARNYSQAATVIG